MSKISLINRNVLSYSRVIKEFLENSPREEFDLLIEYLDNLSNNVFLNKNVFINENIKRFEEKIENFIYDFLIELSKRRHLKLLKKIIANLETERNKKYNILKIEFISSYKLDDEEKFLINNEFSKSFNEKDFNIDFSYDVNIIGGYIIKSNDFEYNNSDIYKLKKLKRHFQEFISF